MLLLKLPSKDLEYLIHHHVIPYSIASDQETHFTAKEVLQRTHTHRIRLLKTWSQKTVYVLKQRPICTISPIARLHGPRNPRAEMGVIVLIVTTSDLLTNFLFPVPLTLCSAT